MHKEDITCIFLFYFIISDFFLSFLYFLDALSFQSNVQEELYNNAQIIQKQFPTKYINNHQILSLTQNTQHHPIISKLQIYVT